MTNLKLAEEERHAVLAGEGTPSNEAEEFPDLDSFEELDRVDDVRIRKEPVPEWKKTVYFASLSAGDMLEFVEANKTAKQTAGLRLILKSLCTKTGRRFHDPKNKEAFARELDTLRKRDAVVTNRLTKAVLEHNGLTKEKQKELEEKIKNDSGEADTAASQSD